MPRTVQGNMYKDIVSGTAITGLIFAAALYLPIIGFFCALFIPLPILFYRSKLGRNVGAIIPVLTIMVMIIVLGRILVDIFPFFAMLLLGFTLGELIEANLSVEKTILYACSIMLLACIVGVLFYGAISNKDVILLISEYVAKNLELTMALYEGMGVSEESIQLISGSLDRIHYVMLRILPALIVSSTLFAAWVSLLLAKPMLKSRTLFYPDYGSLNAWKAPEYLVWGIIGCGLVLLLSDGALKMIGLNGLIILMTVYFFQGIAIMAFYFEKKRFPRVLRIFIYSLIAVQQIMLFIVIGLGFFDIWLNFRRLGKENNS